MRILFALLVVVIAGCKQAPELSSVISPYKIDIQQGNVVTQEMVAKLKAGMTRSQVRFVLGSPLVVDPFHADRWDYVYLYQKQGVADDRRRLTVIFDEDKLVRVAGDVVITDSALEVEKPAVKTPAPATPAPKPKPAVAEKPVTPKSEAAKPVEKPAAKPPVAAAPAAKPAEKPPVAVTPAAKPAAAAAKPAEKPVAQPPAAATPAVKPDAAAAGAPPADAAKPDSAKTDTAKTDDKKEKPKEQGFFGRMLDKIGF
jgi:outer membrane protein assembly factor BamE